MIKFKTAAYLLSKNVINVTKRSLFSDRFTFLEGFVKMRLNMSPTHHFAKSEEEFIHEIKNATISTLLHSTKLWTLMASEKSDHIELLQRSLNRIHNNCSEIQNPQDVNRFIELGQMTMRLFDHLELPDKAIQVTKLISALILNEFSMIAISLNYYFSFITNLIMIFLILHPHRSF